MLNPGQQHRLERAQKIDSVKILPEDAQLLKRLEAQFQGNWFEFGVIENDF